MSVERFDAASDEDWRALVGEVVALANGDGGRIVIACRDDQKPTDSACPRTVDLAASDLIHRLARWTDSPFADVEVQTVRGADAARVEIQVGAAPRAIGLTEPASAPHGKGPVGRRSPPADSFRTSAPRRRS